MPDCEASRAYDAVSYALSASFDWPSRTLTASEEIQLDTTASGPIVELDSAVAVSSVHAGDTTLAFAVDPTAKTLHVDLTPLGSTQPMTFTVEYTALAPVGAGSQQQADSLIATASRDDDPVTSRVVYTDSEPNRALYWLVTKLDPSDRALWGATLTVDPDEDVISNGARLSDTMAGGKRVVAYALDKPIPPYLMAFAAGQLDHTDRTVGTLPMSVWYRHGMVLDPGATLDLLEKSKNVFEAEIIPYPWDTYSVVLLPYGGGMENATITFDDETAGQGNVDLSLQAHEFSHHWFGDWVTMNTYDDVWFKEGMATVLQSEAMKADRDKTSKGRNWGIDYSFNTSESIVDTSLHGLDKYGSGPYQRAAFLISQIRATVGEEQFFNGLRTVLSTYALGSVTGPEFITAFGMSDDLTAQAIASLPKKGAPSLTATPAGSEINFQLSDPDQLMLLGISVAGVDSTGASVDAQTIAPNGTATVTLPPGGYLAVDEHDVFPVNGTDIAFNQTTSNTMDDQLPPLAATLAPLQAFLARSAAQQERVYGLPFSDPALLADYVAGLDSTYAQQNAVEAACGSYAGDATWDAALQPLLETPPIQELDFSLGSCSATTAMTVFEPELAAAMADGSPAALARAEYLISFDYGADTLSVVTPIMTGAPTLRLREYALYRLYYQVQGLYGGVAAASRPAWRTVFENELSDHVSTGRFEDVIYALFKLQDTTGTAKVGAALHSTQLSQNAQIYGVCYVYDLAGKDTSSTAWTSFVAAVGDTSDLASAISSLIVTPTGCATYGFRRAPIEPAYAAPGKHGDVARHR
ncbi:MAG TPA: M1 family aminopeptidase [Kofleriaceae bacterium]